MLAVVGVALGVDPVAAVLTVGNLVLGLLLYRQTTKRHELADALRASEPERRREDEERQRWRQRPVVIVEHAGAFPELGGRGRRMVKVRVTNQGPTVAHEVLAGAIIDGREVQSEDGGRAQTIPALRVGEVREIVVPIPLDSWRSRGLHVDADRPPLWAEWTDGDGFICRVPDEDTRERLLGHAA